MEKEDIVDYVMNTPGNTNRAVLGSMLGELSGGGGFPPVTGSGKSLVSLNGQWQEQNGYGYVEPSHDAIIEWDGNTDDKVSVMNVFYKVSNDAPTLEGLIDQIATDSNGDTYNITTDILEINDNYIISELFLITYVNNVQIYLSPEAPMPLLVPEKGLYFVGNEGYFLRSLTCVLPEITHKINPNYIDGNIFIVHFFKSQSFEEDETYETDKSILQILQAQNDGRLIIGIYNNGYETEVYQCGNVTNSFGVTFYRISYESSPCILTFVLTEDDESGSKAYAFQDATFVKTSIYMHNIQAKINSSNEPIYFTLINDSPNQITNVDSLQNKTIPATGYFTIDGAKKSICSLDVGSGSTCDISGIDFTFQRVSLTIIQDSVIHN